MAEVQLELQEWQLISHSLWEIKKKLSIYQYHNILVVYHYQKS